MPATSPLLSLLLPLVLVAGAPVRYDQRQEGDFNVHAHLENFVVVLIPTSGSNGGLGILDLLKKSGANLRTAEQPIKVTVLEDPPKDQQQSKEDPQQEQQQREGEEDLQAAGTQALEAVLVAESPALVLSRAATGHQGQPEEPAAAEHASTQRREGKAVGEGAGTGGCPQGQFRDATGVCHYIGSDQRIGDQSFFGLEPPFED
ncbi:uncharacterized protein LOC126173912 [Schistocerca cancellata]|uniref:uncharacterized protein LOC126173912 n=1 Tax=Schistocerca cancellata TaxID=274614 RepID=UPI002117DA42|nr:uncharacterized protein LOC126173912 [Schistocerca cancellata]